MKLLQWNSIWADELKSVQKNIPINKRELWKNIPINKREVWKNIPINKSEV